MIACDVPVFIETRDAAGRVSETTALVHRVLITGETEVCWSKCAVKGLLFQQVRVLSRMSWTSDFIEPSRGMSIPHVIVKETGQK